MSRYARQIAVPGFGIAAQERLQRASALVVGAGGLASPVLQYLAGAGVGHLCVVDPDRVETGNLHRQTLFAMADVGRPKVAAAAAAIRALNPEARVTPVQARLDPETVLTLADDADVVLDCADSFAVSYILSDHCHRTGQPLVSASAVGVEGYAGAFCAVAPSLRAVFPDLPARMGSCAGDGVLGPLLAVLGGVQAQMALALLAGLDPSPLGRLVSYDAQAMRFGGFGFLGAPEPLVAHRFIAPAAIRPEDYVVDLRGPSEAALIRPDARRLSAKDLAQTTTALPDPGQRAVLCCRSGLRAWGAAHHLSARWGGEITLVATGDPNGETP